jgi:FkbM family methyltransferase
MRRRVLDVGRRAVGAVLGEQRLVAMTSGREPRQLACRLVPNHYQYEAPALRRVERGGITYELDISDLVDWHVFHDFRDQGRLSLMSLARPGATVIDVGANIGATTLPIAARVGGDGRVIAFEPDPVSRARLEKNLELNDRLAGSVVVSDRALGATRSDGRLVTEDSGNRGLNHLQGNPAGSTATVDQAASGHPVTIRPLDEVLAEYEIPRVDLLKIDVEGREHDVLKGAAGTLDRDHPQIFFELDDAMLRRAGSSPSLLLGELARLGYRCRDANTGLSVDPNGSPEDLHTDLIASAPR